MFRLLADPSSVSRVFGVTMCAEGRDHIDKSGMDALIYRVTIYT